MFTEIWHHYGFIVEASPSCNCFSMDSCSGQDRNPASLLLSPLYSYPSKAVAPLATGSSHLQPVRDPTKRCHGGGHTGKVPAWAGSRHVGTAWQAPTIPPGAAASPVENPSSSHALGSISGHPGFPASSSAVPGAIPS